MQTPLNASATSAGALISSSTFEVPPYQREYSWEKDEVSDFWSDLKQSLDSDANENSYFLGLVILTEEENTKHVVDGQQRILTLTLLAAAIYHESIQHGRKALAERVQSDFLRSIDYDTDETHPRVTLSDDSDNKTLQDIISNGTTDDQSHQEEGSISKRLSESFAFLRSALRKDLAQDPFKRLGAWTEFITKRLYFAVFTHPNTADAYRVFEVINTRGRELTTADLLKNHVLSQTPKKNREERYHEWQSIARPFALMDPNPFVQFIRHVVTVHSGHILPKDLFAFLAHRTGKYPPSIDELMRMLKDNLPLYLQMIDPSLNGPARPEMLNIFSSLNQLGVIAVRPLLLAISNAQDDLEGMRYILRLVVRRIVVGSLGTGNVERRLGDAAKSISDNKNWHTVESDLKDLNPSRQEFIDQVARRSFSKNTLSFIRSSIIGNTTTPDVSGTLHFIMPRQQAAWDGISEEDAFYWGGTIANTFLSTLKRRPAETNNWNGFKHNMLPFGVEHEWISKLENISGWGTASMEEIGSELAETAGNVWY